MIRTKQGKQLAIVIEHHGYDDFIRCYCNSGNLVLSRSELVVVRNQIEAQHFWPMRLYMPYGKWKGKGGSEVLFNRYYQPLWIKKPVGEVEAIDPDTWIKEKGLPILYFNGGIQTLEWR